MRTSEPWWHKWRGWGPDGLILPVRGVARSRDIVQVNTRLHGWCHHQGIGFYDHGTFFEEYKFLRRDGIPLSRRAGESSLENSPTVNCIIHKWTGDWVAKPLCSHKQQSGRTHLPQQWHTAPNAPKRLHEKDETQQSNQFHLYTNAHNMGNKKEELEDTMELEIFDLITLD